MNKLEQSFYDSGVHKSAFTRALYRSIRIILTTFYFGILTPMLNELVLCLVFWVQRGEAVSMNDLISASFMIVWSPLAFAAPALLTGVVFALLITLFRKMGFVICVISSVVGVIGTAFFMHYFTHIDHDVLYYLSGTMQWISSLNAGIFTFILSMLACTIFKSIFMPPQRKALKAACVETSSTHATSELKKVSNIARYVDVESTLQPAT